MSKKKAYVIGTNVSTSLSPTIFEYWFKKHNIDAEYGFIEIKEENFDGEIKSILTKEGLVGLNITMPFKEKIVSYLISQDEHSTKIGATNCVSINNNNTSGTNTDWFGFKCVLENFVKNTYNNHSPDPLFKKIFQRNTASVIGFGGAGKAIIYALIKAGFCKINVFNRSFKKKSQLAKLHLNYPTSSIVTPLDLHQLIYHSRFPQKSDLIVNTTPVTNMFAQYQKPSNHKSDAQIWTLVDKNTTITADINYKLKKNDTNPFFYQIHGIDMLIAQAAPCFESWFGLLPDINDQNLRNLLLEKI